MLALIFDTETTGLVANSLQGEKHQPRVIEFFAQMVDEESGQAVEELEFFCDPRIPLTEEITRITGIKPEDLVGAPRWAEMAGQVSDLIGRADKVVAHNLSYDQFVVEAEMARAGQPVVWPARRVCTVEGTEHLKGHRLNLSALHELLFGEPFAGAHRARVDVQALTRCYLELLKRQEI